MRSARKVCMAGALALLLAANGGRAQVAVKAAPGTTEDALHAMTQQAAVIFMGQVIGMRRLEGTNGATGVVEIEFAVDDAVRGVSGSTYTLREWSGLWAASDQPLRAGQHYLMLLHAPSAAGLSSPVGGTDGAIPISGYEPVQAALGRGTQGWVASGDGRTVDLRWVATRMVRPISYQLESAARPTGLPARLRAETMMATPAQGIEAADTSPGKDVAAVGSAMAPAAEDAGYATVLALLRGWEKSGDAAH